MKDMEEIQSTIKMAIVDNDRLVTLLLQDFFKQNTKIDPLYIANSGREFLEKLEEYTQYPDIILLDLRMEDGSGLDVLDELSNRKEDFKIIVMSSHYNPSFTGQMLRLGCDAFLPKDIDPEDLVYIIEKVYKCGYYFSEDQIVSLRKQVSPRSPKLKLDSKDALSGRELEVLELLCEQLTSKEIAERLFVSAKTIEMHKSNLLLKTGVKNSVGLIIYAVQNKLIDPNSLILLD